MLVMSRGSDRVVNFVAPGAGVLVLGRGRVGHIVKVYCFFRTLPLYRRGGDSCAGA